MAFTCIFDGDIRDLPTNPMYLETLFGKPRAISVGDAHSEIDQLRTALSNLLEDGDVTDRNAARALLGWPLEPVPSPEREGNHD